MQRFFSWARRKCRPDVLARHPEPTSVRDNSASGRRAAIDANCKDCRKEITIAGRFRARGGLQLASRSYPDRWLERDDLRFCFNFKWIRYPSVLFLFLSRRTLRAALHGTRSSRGAFSARTRRARRASRAAYFNAEFCRCCLIECPGDR